MVYKWFLIVLLLFSKSAICSNKNLFVESSSISVKIERVESSCSSIKLTYYVDKLNQDVIIPKGITGIESENFNLATLSLQKVGITERRFPLNLDSDISGEIILRSESSPYVVSLDILTVFGKLSGEFYLKFSYSSPFNYFTTTDGVDIGVTDVIVSDRYLLSFSENGCIERFIGD